MSQSRRWCFTLNNPTLPYPTLESLTAKYVIFQLEEGSNGTPHLQGYVEFGRPVRLAQAKHRIPGAHFEPAKGSAEQNRKYCSKSPRLGDTIELGERSRQGQRNDLKLYVQAVREGLKPKELLEEFPTTMARYPNLRSEILQIDRSASPTLLNDFRGWQNEVLRVAGGDPDDRSIHWYWEEFGGVGKTTMAKHLVAMGGFYTSGGKYADIIHAYSMQSIVIFDLGRDFEEKVPYVIMEGFKNGIISSGKYNSCTKTFKSPHVFVFANFAPDKRRLSVDRWRVTHIIEDSLNYIMTS